MTSGIHFEPRTGGGFLNSYSAATRDLARADLALARAALPNLDEIVVPWVAHWNASWPQPLPDEAGRLADFLRDAAAAGWRVELFLSHPHTIPTSVDPLSVSGHRAGETVNGYRLHWDIPPVEDVVREGRLWYTSAIGEIARAAPQGVVSRVLLGGHHRAPFATEFGGLNLPRYRDATAQYLVDTGEAVQSASPWSVSHSLLPALGQTGEAMYEGLRLWARSGCWRYGDADVTTKRQRGGEGESDVREILAALCSLPASVSDLGLTAASDEQDRFRRLARHGGEAVAAGLSWWAWSITALRGAAGSIGGPTVDLLNALAAQP